jgi:hypothetical protein
VYEGSQIKMRKQAPQLVTDLRPSALKPSFSKRFRKKFGKNGKLAIVILAIAALSALSYGYIHTRNELNRLSNPQETSKNDTQQLVDKVGKLIVLPTGDAPTAATINDVSKLKSQEFFSRAKDGDKVLVYAKSGRAVLYRPSINKVVEYSKVNLNNP